MRGRQLPGGEPCVRALNGDKTANANLAARLPYLFACSRFAHYLKCIARDKVGSFKEKDDMQRWLQDWILQYVDGDPANSSEETKARRPLAAAEVVVEEVEGNPGYYTSKFFLRPHYQLEGLTVSLRLVSKLPSAKAASMLSLRLSPDMWVNQLDHASFAAASIVF